MATICRNGLISFELLQGSYNSELLVQYLEQTFYERLPKDYLETAVVIMDNARFHHSAVVRQWFRDKDLTLEFLPPYSPQLNPIEEVFSMIKARYRSVTQVMNAFCPDLAQP